MAEVSGRDTAGWFRRVMGVHVERWQADMVERIATGEPIRASLTTKVGAAVAPAVAPPRGRYATTPIAFVCARCDVAGRGNACWWCDSPITWSGPTRAADDGVVPIGAGLMRQLDDARASA